MLPLGKMYIWEVATWEIVTWEVALGKMPLGKYLTPMFTVLLNYQYAQSPVWMEKISGKIKNGEN